MGYMRHHTIVVESWDGVLLARAHRQASVTLGTLVGPIVQGWCNAHAAFFVAPDGSKEGWDDSARGDAARDAFVRWLDAQRYEDGSTSLRWVEVQFGDDEHETKVVRDSDAVLREKYARQET